MLERVGNRVSQALHQLVFSFPSPNITDQTLSAPAPSPGSSKADHGVHAMTGNAMIDEPGETRALAGGVGPLSFAGSGYGVTLVLMVRSTSKYVYLS